VEGDDRWQLWQTVLQRTLSVEPDTLPVYNLGLLSQMQPDAEQQTELHVDDGRPSSASSSAAATIPAAPAAAAAAASPLLDPPPSVWLMLQLLHRYGLDREGDGRDLVLCCLLGNNTALLRWWLSGARRHLSMLSDWQWAHLRPRLPAPQLLQHGADALRALDEAVEWWRTEAQPQMQRTLQAHLNPDLAAIVLDYVQAPSADLAEVGFAVRWPPAPQASN